MNFIRVILSPLVFCTYLRLGGSYQNYRKQQFRHKTPKQVERVKEKIKRLKAALAFDRKQWGGFHHDGQGIRYLIPAFYIKIEDYKGGQRYFNWFNKTFSDDSGDPAFLFEWAITLFMNGKTTEAGKKLFEAFSRNTYIIDKFLGKEIIAIDKWEGSGLESPDFTNYFIYSATDPKLAAFSEWLKLFVETEKFSVASEKFLEIQKKLKDEDDKETRQYLLKAEEQLILNF